MKKDIKIRLRHIVGSVNSLRELSTKELPAKVSYRLARSMRAIDSEIEIYQDTLNQLREKYVNNPHARGEKADWKTDTSEDEFVEEANELLQEKVTISIDQIKASELGTDVKPGVLVDCYYLFEDMNDDHEEPASSAG